MAREAVNILGAQLGLKVTIMKWAIKGKKKAQEPFGLQTWHWPTKPNYKSCLEIGSTSRSKQQPALQPSLETTVEVGTTGTS